MPLKSHHRLKKRATQNKNPQLEKAMLFVAIAEPLMTLPQIIELYSNPGAAHVSVITWALYMSASVMWLVYGLRQKNRPLTFTGVLWIIMDALVVIGTFLKS